MDRTTFEQAKEIVERIERGKSLMEQLRKASEKLGDADSEGLREFLEAFHEMSDGKLIMKHLVDLLTKVYTNQLRELEEQLEKL